MEVVDDMIEGGLDGEREARVRGERDMEMDRRMDGHTQHEHNSSGNREVAITKIHGGQ